MNILSFLNSPLLWGMALVSVPIIIHLLFRRRFRRIEWAPMKYLKLSIQKNRRRIRLEQLLLLLLRCLIPLLLFFMVARPILHAQGLGSWLGARSRTSHVVLLDDSLSMGFQQDGRSAWERAKGLAAQVADAAGKKDRFTLILASRPATPLLQDTEIEGAADVVGELDQVALSDMHVAWDTVFKTVTQAVDRSSYPIRDLTIVTDLRREGWDDTLDEITAKLSELDVQVKIFDVGSAEMGNVALVDLVQTDRHALVGVETHWQASVRNDTNGVITNADATWSVDGKPTAVRLPDINPGETIKVDLSRTFQEAGDHTVTFSLPMDQLPGDNTRQLVAQALEHLNVVVVDGEPSSEPLSGEVSFLTLSLAVGIGEAEAIRVTLMDDAEFASSDVGAPDLVILANVASISPEKVQSLTRLVQQGTGLMIFVGEQVDATNYNDLLWNQGNGLLPCSLEAVVDNECKGLLLEEGVVGPLDALRQLNPSVLERVHLTKFQQVQLPPTSQSGVRVLARWNTPDAPVAAVEKKVGEGTVILWTVTADKQWSDWPTEASYVMAIRESSIGIAKSSVDNFNTLAGEPMRLPMGSGKTINSAMLEAPQSDQPVQAEIQVLQPEPGVRKEEEQMLVYALPRLAGSYVFTWQEPPNSSYRQSFAANPDRRESTLTRINNEQLLEFWGSVKPEIIAAAQSDDVSIAVRGQEIWRTLARFLMGILVCEACLATWVGRQR